VLDTRVRCATDTPLQFESRIDTASGRAEKVDSGDTSGENTRRSVCGVHSERRGALYQTRQAILDACAPRKRDKGGRKAVEGGAAGKRREGREGVGDGRAGRRE
jgi:hypothetical protein